MAFVGGSTPIVPNFSIGDLNARSTKFVRLLEGLGQAVESHDIDLKSQASLVDHFFRELRKVGLAAYNKVIFDDFMQYLISQECHHGAIHFACHCENPQHDDATQARIILTSRGTQLEITLETLETWLMEGGFTKKPFVFLNACESATMGHLLESVNFPETFIRFGAGGVIATACIIPDKFASAFATEFYRRLLRLETLDAQLLLPHHIGEVLLETRLYFLEKYNNPLGLAYGLYALANQRLELDP